MGVLDLCLDNRIKHKHGFFCFLPTPFELGIQSFWNTVDKISALSTGGFTCDSRCTNTWNNRYTVSRNPCLINCLWLISEVGIYKRTFSKYKVRKHAINLPFHGRQRGRAYFFLFFYYKFPPQLGKEFETACIYWLVIMNGDNEFFVVWIKMKASALERF